MSTQASGSDRGKHYGEDGRQCHQRRSRCLVDVFDWVMATVGDPLADRYRDLMGRSLMDVAFYHGLAIWKLARRALHVCREGSWAS